VNQTAFIDLVSPIIVTKLQFIRIKKLLYIGRQRVTPSEKMIRE